jgi:cardiolipin synthase
MKASDIPNLITVARILLTGPIAYTALIGNFELTVLLMFVGGVSDAVDGFLARRFRWQSRLGSILDPIADKLLIVTLFLVLGWLELIPWWLVAVVLARDLVIVAGAVAYHYLVGPYSIVPSLVSKLNTLLQIMLILAAVISQVEPQLTGDMLDILIYAVLGSSILSGIDYVLIWGVRALRNDRKVNSAS